MQVNEASRKDGGRRRRRRRRRGGAGKQGGHGHVDHRIDPDDDRSNAPRFPAADPSDGLTPFNLFCAYHLGVTKDNTFKFQSMPEVAKRFGLDIPGLKERILAWQLDSESMRRAGFDGELMQLDIRVAPEGVSRRELARSMWLDLGRSEPDEDVPEEDWDEDEYDEEDEEAEAP